MFENFISLGERCLTAAALSKYGLRNTSGPFDWCFSSMEGVLTLLENDFEDFMDYSNLSVDKDDNKVFHDKKYKIIYNHDIKVSLENDYAEIKEKYQRRIERFLIMLHNPTCFVRVVPWVNELEFIRKTESRILAAVKKYNIENDIIFVVPNYVYENNLMQIQSKIFIVNNTIELFNLGREEGRSFFDTNRELIDFCIRNYNPEKRKDNLIFDLRAELRYAKANKDTCRETVLKEILAEYERQNIKLRSRLERWMRIVNTNYSSIDYCGKIAIYGCGAIGKTLYNYMKKDFEIIEFIDRNPKCDVYGGIPVNTVNNAISDRGTLIIIIPTYDYDKIKAELAETFEFEPTTIPLEAFLEKGEIIDSDF